MKEKRITRIVAIALAILALGAFILYEGGYFEKWFVKADGAKNGTKAQSEVAPVAVSVATNAVPVKAIIVTPESLTDFISVSGSTVPAEEVTVSSEVPGKVAEILFREGDYVKTGAPLIRLDISELAAERKRLQVELELNKKIAERYRGLYAKEGVSLQELEVVEADVEKSKADLALVDAQLEKRLITAPFSGRLGLRQVSEGAYLAPGDPIVDLVKYNPIKIEFSVPERYSQSVGVGALIEFQLQGVPGNRQARVEAVEPRINPNTRTFTMKASTANPGGKILPGAFTNVKVSLENFDNALLIPTEAVVPELNKKTAYVVRKGKAEKVTIVTGIRQESTVQVTQGLTTGDTVITSGVLQIKPGVPVVVTEIE